MLLIRVVFIVIFVATIVRVLNMFTFYLLSKTSFTKCNNQCGVVTNRVTLALFFIGHV